MSGKYVYVGGVKMTPAQYRALQRAVKSPDRTRRRGRAKWPIESVALAVHPDQIAEATARNKRHGCSVEYTPKGKAVIPDEGQFKKLRKIEGVFDKDSYN